MKRSGFLLLAVSCGSAGLWLAETDRSQPQVVRKAEVHATRVPVRQISPMPTSVTPRQAPPPPDNLAYGATSRFAGSAQLVTRDSLLEMAAKVEMEANHELASLAASLDLTPEQQDRMFQVLASNSAHYHPAFATDGSDTSSVIAGNTVNQSEIGQLRRAVEAGIVPPMAVQLDLALRQSSPAASLTATAPQVSAPQSYDVPNEATAPYSGPSAGTTPQSNSADTGGGIQEQGEPGAGDGSVYGDEPGPVEQVYEERQLWWGAIIDRIGTDIDNGAAP
jgi:hypothetical protein